MKCFLFCVCGLDVFAAWLRSAVSKFWARARSSFLRALQSFHSKHSARLQTPSLADQVGNESNDAIRFRPCRVTNFCHSLAASPSHPAPASFKLETTPNPPQSSDENVNMPAAHHILLLGGHGKVAQLLTPLLLRRGWDVTSVIRSAEQVPDIERLSDAVGDKQQGGKLTVLVRSLEEVKSEGAAKGVLDEVVGKGLDYVVWSAGG